jgi:hypothetical protein
MTGGVEAVLVLYEALSPDEREAVFERVSERRAAEQGAQETELARHLRSLRRVAEVVGCTPSVDEYRLVSKRLRAAGEDVESFASLYKHFRHSWPLAREALDLTQDASTRQVEARLRSRRVGKVARYSEADLREALARAVAHYRRPPSIVEFSWWRDRQLELASAEGREHPNIPSDSCYRSRWKTWEAALLHFGHTPEEVALRLEARSQVFNGNDDAYLPDDLPVALLSGAEEAGSYSGLPVGLPLSAQEAVRVRDCYEAMPRRTRYVLTVRLGLGVPKQRLRDAADPLALHLTRIHQLQLYALDALLHAASDGRRVTRPGLRSDIIEALRRMSQRTEASPILGTVGLAGRPTGV